MKEYKFVPLKLGLSGVNPDYKDIINKHAKEGWKLVQILFMSSYAFAEVILERDHEND